MKPTPPGWPRIAAALFYVDAARMIDWLCEAFGFEIRLKVEGDDGQIQHSELTYGEGLIMVSGERTGASAARFGSDLKSPASVGASTQNLMLYVDDVEAHCARARAAGARITAELETHDYGEDHWADRGYCALDPEGHVWWFSQRLRSPAP